MKFPVGQIPQRYCSRAFAGSQNLQISLHQAAGGNCDEQSETKGRPIPKTVNEKDSVISQVRIDTITGGELEVTLRDAFTAEDKASPGPRLRLLLLARQGDVANFGWWVADRLTSSRKIDVLIGCAARAWLKRSFAQMDGLGLGIGDFEKKLRCSWRCALPLKIGGSAVVRLRSSVCHRSILLACSPGRTS